MIALVLASVLFKGTKMVVAAIEPPECHSDAATSGLMVALHDSALGTIAVNNATTISGGLLSNERTCVADIAPVRGGVDAEHMTWRRVLYQVKTSDNPDQADVTAQMGDAVPLAPERSFFMKWLEYFLD